MAHRTTHPVGPRRARDPLPAGAHAAVEALLSGDVAAAVSAAQGVPVWSLGTAYERRLSGARRRRSGAVYTPPDLAADVVDRTIARLLARCGDVRGALRLRILDPACGAGAFLVAAAERLLRAFPAATNEERRALVTTCLAGVDTDGDAVQVSKLGLAMLAGGGASTFLGLHVHPGDALLDPVPGGPFDAVIGNPPYLGIDATYGRSSPYTAALRRAYASIWRDKLDLQACFIARAVELTRGEVGLLLSRAVLEAFKADRLRGWLAEQADVREIVDFRARRLFPGVGITSAVVVLTRAERVATATITRARGSHDVEVIEVPQAAFGAGAWAFADGDTHRILAAIDAAGEPLSEVLRVGQGMQTGLNAAFGRLTTAHVEAWDLPSTHWFKRARNSDIRRWSVEDRGEVLLYPNAVDRFERLPEGARRHLEAFRPALEARAACRRGDCAWWQYTWPLHADCARRPRILCPYLAGGSRFALDESAAWLGLTDTTVLYDDGQAEPLRYVLGLLNSRLLAFRYRAIAKLRSAGIAEYFWNGLSRLPIRRVDPATASGSDLARRDRIVALVGRCLSGDVHAEHAIDREVYALYRVSERDRAVVDASFQVGGG